MIRENEKKPRFKYREIILADWQSYTIGDEKTNRVVCHLLPENGKEYNKKLAEKMTIALNTEFQLMEYLNDRIAHYSNGDEMKSISESVTDSFIIKELELLKQTIQNS